MISNRTISWSEEMNKPPILSTLLILVSPNATNHLTESTSHSRMARTSLVPPDMLLSTPTSVMSNRGEMILRPLVTCYSISSRGPFHGKDLPVEQSKKNTLILRKRRRRQALRSSAEISQTNSRSSCTIAEASASPKIQTMVTSLVYSRAA